MLFISYLSPPRLGLLQEPGLGGLRLYLEESVGTWGDECAARLAWKGCSQSSPGLPTWQWSGKEMKDGEVKVNHKIVVSGMAFLGYFSLSYFVPKTSKFTKISHCSCGRKFKSKAYQVLVYRFSECVRVVETEEQFYVEMAICKITVGQLLYSFTLTERNGN